MIKKRRKDLERDVRDVLAMHPGLSVVEKGEVPTAIKGKYVVQDDRGAVQGEFKILVLIPSNYPYEFPVLIETSKVIERKEARHINRYGIACEEIDPMERIIAATGITLLRYFQLYVHKYLCWQLIFEQEGNQNLEEWAHGEEGIKDFYREYLGKDDFTVGRILTSLGSKQGVGRNEPCPCGSGKKVKKCHSETFASLLRIGREDLRKSAGLFQSVPSN